MKKKARRNLAKHGVSFDEAKRVFDDPFAVELTDDRFDYGEERFLLIGMAERRLLTVVHVEREGWTRIISAWPATRIETDDYFKAQSDS